MSLHRGKTILFYEHPSIYINQKKKKKEKKGETRHHFRLYFFLLHIHRFLSSICLRLNNFTTYSSSNTTIHPIASMANINLYFVRHGQRIDQINSSWAATSPCPQDPPLTDQGRSQARQTGKMIRDFALEQSQYSKRSNRTKPRISQDATRTSVQRITPPESPNLDGVPSLSNGVTGGQSSSSSARRHHFAIVTSPFLRCAQTAIEMAIGIASSENNHSNDRDTTIAVEAGLAGK